MKRIIIISIIILMMPLLGYTDEKDDEKKEKKNINSISRFYDSIELYKLRKYEMAITALLDAYKSNNKNEDIIFYLALCYKRNGNIEKSIQHFKEVIQLNQYSINSYHNLADMYYDLRKYDEAIKFYNKILELRQNDEASLYSLGKIYFKNNDFINSKKYLMKFIEVYKSNIKDYPIFLEDDYYNYFKQSEVYLKAINKNY